MSSGVLSSSTEIILDSLCFTVSVSEYDFIANGGHGEVEVSAISRLLCLEVVGVDRVSYSTRSNRVVG